MSADRYPRVAKDEPVGPNAVKVFDGDGRLLRIISSASLSARDLGRPSRHITAAVRPKNAPRPSVAAVRTLVRRLKREPV